MPGALAILIGFVGVRAAEKVTSAPAHVLNLWPAGAIGLPDDGGAEVVSADGSVAHVSRPEISVYPPLQLTKPAPALLVCAGGSYTRVGRYTTGMGMVDHFRPLGFAIVVLKYRTSPPSADVQADALADAQRAMRLVRHHARDWGIDPTRIGMIGSSAGAHLILNATSRADLGDPRSTDPVERESSVPNFIGLLCPWPAGKTMEAFDLRPGAPPAFVCSALDDAVAPTAFARDIVAAFERIGADATLWTVATGGHRAFTLGGRGEGARWVDHFHAWLQARRLLP